MGAESGGEFRGRNNLMPDIFFLPQNAMPPTRPRPRARIESRFRIHADKLFFERLRLRIKGLSGFHGA